MHFELIWRYETMAKMLYISEKNRNPDRSQLRFLFSDGLCPSRNWNPKWSKYRVLFK